MSSFHTKIQELKLIAIHQDFNNIDFNVILQDMDLKNGRKEPVNIVVTDQLPKSNDDKVKVGSQVLIITSQPLNE